MNMTELLTNPRTYLADGAMGTELQKRGMEDGACPELLNLSNPALLRSIHHDYITAGADIIETNTFGANRARLKFHDMQDHVAEIISAAVENAKGLPGEYLIAGSMGPTGEILEPLGTLAESEAYDIFAEQASAFNKAGVDIIFIETMMAPEEVVAAIRAVKENSKLPVAAMMTFERGNAGIRTMWGNTVADVAFLLEQHGADIIGSNCGRGFDEMTGVVSEYKAASGLPIIAMANAGLPVWEDGKSVYKDTPEKLSGYISEILRSGVKILGGCCGTGPEHTAEMRRILNLFSSKGI